MSGMFSPEAVNARRYRRNDWLEQMGYNFPPETVEAFHRYAEQQFTDRATRAIAIFKDYEAKHSRAAREDLERRALIRATADKSKEFLDHLEDLLAEEAAL
jgi:hypothetical protein